MSVVWLYAGAAALLFATITILGYETHAAFRGPEPTISALVRAFNRQSIKRKGWIFAAITVVAMSIQFLAIHFVFPVG